MNRSWTKAIAALGLVLLSSMQAVAAPKVKLRAVLPLAQGSWLYQGLQRFKKNAESNSKGDIEVVIMPSSPVYGGKDIKSAVASGAIEIGALLLSDYGADIPAANFFAQPFMFFSEPILKAGVASQSPVRAPLDRAILQSNGVRVLWWQAAGATVLISKGEAVLTPADIAGKKVQVPLAALAQMVQLCGATPVEAASGPDSGPIKSATTDMVIVPIANVVDGKLWTSMTTLTITHHIAQEFVIGMNERVFNSLTADEKRALQDAAEETERYMYDDIRQDENENIELAAKNGMKVAEVTAVQATLWKACATPMLESFLQQSGDLGQKVMDGYRRILVDNYRPQRK